jgi:hypothetical protein
VNHAAFAEFAKLTKTPYRVFFTTRSELDSWLNERGYALNEDDSADDDSIREWINTKSRAYLKLTHDIFDKHGNLMNIAPSEWQQDWLQRIKLPDPTKTLEKAPTTGGGGYDDADYATGDNDIPF